MCSRTRQLFPLLIGCHEFGCRETLETLPHLHDYYGTTPTSVIQILVLKTHQLILAIAISHDTSICQGAGQERGITVLVLVDQSTNSDAGYAIKSQQHWNIIIHCLQKVTCAADCS